MIFSISIINIFFTTVDCYAATTKNGTCGDILTWEYYQPYADPPIGTLTISGTGDMYDYSDDEYSDRAPWKYFSNQITSVKIKDGITHIGSHAFHSPYAFGGEIDLPQSVTSIGEYAFSTCRAESISLSDNISEIGDHAFENCFKLRNINLPSKITKIDDSLFKRCEKLNSLIIPSNVSSIEKNAFYNMSDLLRIYIPSSVNYMAGDSLDATLLQHIIHLFKSLMIG